MTEMAAGLVLLKHRPSVSNFGVVDGLDTHSEITHSNAPTGSKHI
jgi:hypothetical protein